MRSIVLRTGIGCAAACMLIGCGTGGPVVVVNPARHHDVSRPLQSLRVDGSPAPSGCGATAQGCGMSPDFAEHDGEARPESFDRIVQGQGIEQRSQGQRPPAVLLTSFDGHGFGMVGPHGTGGGRNPSDNSMAVGPDHIVEIVNSQLAVYTKKGAVFDTTGTVLFGPIGTNILFAGFGGQCELAPNGDAVVRYDQLAERWLYVMPLFRRAPSDPGEPPGPYGMCYAVSTGPNPIGPYYRYEFERTLFPDYPRPAVWPDGYYVPTSTGDDVIEKHACVVDRTRMLMGEPATEQCVIVPDVNFLNNADLDGQTLPPDGAPNIVMATGGAQLNKDFDDDGIYAWKFHVDWDNPENTDLIGPVKITVAPYHYLCDGQLTRCVPQPGTDMRLDSQGDKIMQRLVYRNVLGRESIVAVHSVNTASGGGGVRWYEFRLDHDGNPHLHQQGTYAPDSAYRWMASPGMDRQGNIGIGYSYGGTPHYAGQRFAGRLDDDPPGLLTLHETILIEGQGAQSNTLRWQDYTQLSMDPSDDCTFWYVGDYLKEGAPSYTTRIGAFRLPGCLRGTVEGTAFYDRNHNGVREPNEPGLSGWTISVEAADHMEPSAPATRTLTTDPSGRFSTWLPADPAYSDPTYLVSAPAPTAVTWMRTVGGTAYATSGMIAMTGGTYRFVLRDRDQIVNLDFGNVCMARNTRGASASYWLGESGASTLRANDEKLSEGRGPGRFFGRRMPGGWRRLVNTTIYLANADGSRFTVDGQSEFDDAYADFATWWGVSLIGSIWQRAAGRVAATALSVVYGDQTGTVTVFDPIVRDWPSVIQLVDRVSTVLADHGSGRLREADTGAVTAYEQLLEDLNNNDLEVTPPDPQSCRPPLQ